MGKPRTGRTKTRKTIMLDNNLLAKLNKLAKKRKCKYINIYEDALTEYFNNLENSKDKGA